MQGSAIFNGGEIAHRMSAVRFHRVIWIDKGIERNANLPNPLNTQVNVDIQQSTIALIYDGTNGDQHSEYSLKLQLESRNV